MSLWASDYDRDAPRDLLTDDRKPGGHVLSCQVKKVTVEIETTGELNMVLPSDPAFYHVDLSTSSPKPSGATE